MENTNLIETPEVEESGMGYSSKELEKIPTAIGTYLAEISAEGELPDIQVALSANGVRRFFTAGALPGKCDTQPLDGGTFEANCVFKPMMAAVALELSARGLLDIDVSIGKYIPELADTPKTSSIKVRHLLTNTAGYRGFPVFPPLFTDEQRRRAFSRIREATSLYWPGLVFSYENSTTALLAEILGRSCQHQVGPLVREILFDPIGISPDLGPARDAAGLSNSITDSAERINLPSMGLSIPDFLTIAETLAGVTTRHRSMRHQLSSSTLAELHQKVIDIPRTAGSKAFSLIPNAASTGLFIFKDGFLGYDGMSANETLGFRLCPQRKIVVVLAIRRGNRHLRRAILRGILDRIVAIGDRFEDASSSLKMQEATFNHKELSGYYSGNHGCDALVRASPRQVQLVGLGPNAKPFFSLSGRMTERGTVSFPSTNASMDPTFFRYERTGEPCVMIGMTALKKLPVVVATNMG